MNRLAAADEIVISIICTPAELRTAGAPERIAGILRVELERAAQALAPSPSQPAATMSDVNRPKEVT